MCVYVHDRHRQWHGIVQRRGANVLLENLLQDFHLLLLQRCHHIHAISQTLWEGPYTHTNSHVTGVFSVNMSSLYKTVKVCLVPSVCALIPPTVPFFNDPEGLKLQLHVFLDHQRSKHLEIICRQYWLENRLKQQQQERWMNEWQYLYDNDEWMASWLGKEMMLSGIFRMHILLFYIFFLSC